MESQYIFVDSKKKTKMQVPALKKAAFFAVRAPSSKQYFLAKAKLYRYFAGRYTKLYELFTKGMPTLQGPAWKRNGRKKIVDADGNVISDAGNPFFFDVIGNIIDRRTGEPAEPAPVLDVRLELLRLFVNMYEEHFENGLTVNSVAVEAYRKFVEANDISLVLEQFLDVQTITKWNEFINNDALDTRLVTDNEQDVEQQQQQIRKEAMIFEPVASAIILLVFEQRFLNPGDENLASKIAQVGNAAVMKNERLRVFEMMGLLLGKTGAEISLILQQEKISLVGGLNSHFVILAADIKERRLTQGTEQVEKRERDEEIEQEEEGQKRRRGREEEIEEEKCEWCFEKALFKMPVSNNLNACFGSVYYYCSVSCQQKHFLL